MSTFSNNTRQKAKTFLEGLFSILEDMVTQTMKSNPNPNNSSELSEVQKDLKKVKAHFVEDEQSVLDKVTDQLETYRSRIQQLLADDPQPSVPPNLEDVRKQLENR